MTIHYQGHARRGPCQGIPSRHRLAGGGRVSDLAEGDGRVTRCPLCGAAVRSISRESGGRWSLSCGDWITDEQAAPILAARGDDT